METRDKVLELVKNNQRITGSEIARRLGISRQAVNKHLRKLLKLGLIYKCGNTRNGFFTTEPELADLRSSLKRSLRLKVQTLQEDKLFERVDFLFGLKAVLRENVYNIFHYVFTEMVNNVIEHSNSEEMSVTIQVGVDDLVCEIRDWGIGIFESVRSKFALESEEAASFELIKGKMTTMPERHSGEGIFFSSKATDRFIIRSHRIKTIVDNIKDDIFVSEEKFISGTDITFSINKNSKTILKNIFDKFAKEEYDFEFSTTLVKVKLLGESFISRSEAKRLLNGLDKFREIVLDFSNVKTIGQGFADEIFRVFKNTHPQIKIVTINTSSVIEEMIKHIK